MNKILYIFICILTLAGCKDDAQDYISVQVPDNAFTFKPIMGGAVMYYKMPDDPDIMGIHVRYKDAYGKDILRSGSNVSDSLMLIGFNESVDNVPAKVFYVTRDSKESFPVDVTFSTLDSAPVKFINSAEVKSYWNGFSLNYDAGDNATGMAHVFYLGDNPLTGESDTVLVNSFTLENGKDTVGFQLEQLRPVNTVVVKVEDYRGYIVKERIWKDVKALLTEKLSPDNFNVIYSNSMEDESRKIGLKYLTDGDTKGESWFKSLVRTEYFTFISNKNGVGDLSTPMYVDLKGKHLTSSVRFYAHLGIEGDNPDFYSLNTYYYNLLPCAVDIYGCKEDGNEGEWDSKKWELIGSFNEDPDSDVGTRWEAHAWGYTHNYDYLYKTLEDMQQAKPIYKEVLFPVDKQDDGFRFLKIVFHGTFNMDYETPSMSNKGLKRLSLQELEVYTSKN